MSARWEALRLWARALLTGLRFERAVQRNRVAARELDMAVREVLEK